MCRKTDGGMNSAKEPLSLSYPAEIDRVLVAAFLFPFSIYLHLFFWEMYPIVELYLQDSVLYIYLTFQHAVIQIFHEQEIAAADIYPCYLAHRHSRDGVDKGSVEAGTCF